MQSLSQVLDIFKCCIFNWGALTTILPSFVISGAIIAFMPSWQLTKYLGKGSKRYISYPIAAFSGAILPACSCNIVPLFASILERGAGVGPAFTFLYAGPAINLISFILTFKVFGPLVGISRLVGVLAISIILGLVMELLFKTRNKEPSFIQTPLKSEQIKKGRLCLLLALLFAILISGSSLTTPSSVDVFNNKVWLYLKVITLFTCLALLLILIITKFKKTELLDWLKQTFKLIKLIVPLFIISVLVIGLATKYFDLRWIQQAFIAQKDSLGNHLFFPTLKATFFGGLFGELMYFPILSEVAFVKAFFKLGMDIGPAIAILLAGPGTSLPGLIIISRFVSWKKVGAYFLLSLVLGVIFATTIAMFSGKYMCACLFAK